MKSGCFDLEDGASDWPVTLLITSSTILMGNFYDLPSFLLFEACRYSPLAQLEAKRANIAPTRIGGTPFALLTVALASSGIRRENINGKYLLGLVFLFCQDDPNEIW
jgi:hypothetical protein